MATAGLSAPGRAPRPFARRWLEWGLLGAVVLALVVWLMLEGRKVQGQAELAAVQTTLGALRTAGILHDLQARASGRPVAGPVPAANPFDLLKAHPANYLGVLDAAQALQARPGTWHFEPACSCVVYLPLDPRWLQTPSGLQALRFRVRVGAGPLQLEPMETYRWQGQQVE